MANSEFGGPVGSLSPLSSSVSPPQPPSYDDDERALKKGRARPLIVVGLLGCAAIGIGTYALQGDEEIEAYRQIGRQINGLDQRGFDGFWACALSGATQDEIREASVLMEEIHRRGATGRGAYAAQVRDQCVGRLAEVEVGLESPTIPQALQPDVHAMHEATTALRGAWSDYLGLLDAIPADGAYDQEAATETVTAIARGWHDYKHAYASFNDHIRTKLTP